MKEKEMKITAPEGCEIEKVEIVDGVAVVKFREKEQKMPKSWEEFCDMHPVKRKESYISQYGCILDFDDEVLEFERSVNCKNLLPDHATAEAVLALCQLIQLRNAYNGDWAPDWEDEEQEKYVITFVCCDEITITDSYNDAYSPLYFKNKEIADEFLSNFRPLIEKLQPLYGIKEGGEE